MSIYSFRKLFIVQMSFLLSLGSAFASEDLTVPPEDDMSFRQAYSSTNVLDYDPTGADEVGAAVDPGQNFNLNSNSLGLMGPIQFTSQYSDLYGWIFGGTFATDIGERNALALDVEAGSKQNRFNATWGFLLTDTQRLKLTFERLAQKMKFDFDSGSVREWVPQYAGGVGYQYILDMPYVKTFDANAYYSRAESTDLDNVLFDNDASIEMRRIAGGTSRGLSAGVGVQPWVDSVLKLNAYYDDLTYDTKHQSSDAYDKNGVGASAEFEQVLFEYVKASGLASMRAGYNEYGGGLSVIVPNTPGIQLELGVDASYLDAKSTGQDDTRIALNAAISFDPSFTATNTVYGGFSDPAVKSLKDWTREAAVRMTEVYAIADSKVVSAQPQPVGSFPTTVQRYINSPVDIDVSPFFVSEDGSSLTYTTDSALPVGVVLQPNGVFTGNTPAQVNGVQETYPISVIATNTWGIASDPESFDLIVTNAVPPQITLQLQRQFETELTAYENNEVADSFIDPNPHELLDEQGSSTALTYELDPVEGWSDLKIDNTTGVLTGTVPAFNTPSINEIGNATPEEILAEYNTYEVSVYAVNFVGQKSNANTYPVIVQPENAGTLTGPDTLEVDGDEGNPMNDDLSANFSTTNGTLAFTTDDNALLTQYGLQVTSQGVLTGTPTLKGGTLTPQFDFNLIATNGLNVFKKTSTTVKINPAEITGPADGDVSFSATQGTQVNDSTTITSAFEASDEQDTLVYTLEDPDKFNQETGLTMASNGTITGSANIYSSVFNDSYDMNVVGSPSGATTTATLVVELGLNPAPLATENSPGPDDSTIDQTYTSKENMAQYFTAGAADEYIVENIRKPGSPEPGVATGVSSLNLSISQQGEQVFVVSDGAFVDGDFGVFLVTVTARNDFGDATQTYELTVQDTDVGLGNPLEPNGLTMEADELQGRAINLTTGGYFTGSNLIYSASSNPKDGMELSLTRAGGDTTLFMLSDTPGVYTITVGAYNTSNGENNPVTQDFVLTVTSDLPVASGVIADQFFANPTNYSIPTAQSFSGNAEEDEPEYSLKGYNLVENNEQDLPTNMSIDKSSGVITGVSDNRSEHYCIVVTLNNKNSGMAGYEPAQQAFRYDQKTNNYQTDTECSEFLNS